MNGLDYISAHLGYRYVIRDSDFSHAGPFEEDARLTVTLENTGFSGCYRPFNVSLFMRHTGTQWTYKIPVEADTRFFTSGTVNRLEIPLNVHDYIAGTYNLYLKLSDPVTGCEVLLANDALFHEEYGCPLGTLDLSILPEFSK